MNKIERPNSSQSNFLTTVMAILALMVWLGMSHQTLGQSQWTTNGNNINNTNTGNVGIGTSTPNAKLVVIGGNVGLGSNDMETWTSSSAVLESTNTSIFFGLVADIHILSNTYHNNGWKYKATGPASDYYLYNGMHSWRVAPSGTIDTAITWAEAMTLNNSGFLGIGTTNPTHRLHIAGNNTVAGGYPLIKLQNTQSGGHSYWLYSGANNVAGDFTLFDETDNAFRLYVKGTSGNVGIGTNTPAAKLDVNGNVNFRGGQTFFRQSSGLAGGEGTLFNTGGTANNESYFDMSVYRAGSYTSRFGVDNYGRMYLQPGGGNVGVGTSAPAYRFDVQGGQINASGGLCIAGDCKTAWSQVGGSNSQWTTSGSNIYYNTGNVAIGTTTAGYSLDVLSNSNIIARFSSSAAINNQVLIDAPAGYNSNLTLQNGGVPKWYLGNRAANNRFSFIEATGSLEALSILQNGNVGIGTTAPAEKLDVVGNAKVTGNITVTGNINAKYQDVAEWVPSRQKLTAGTVVVLDTEQSNHVVASSSTYDTRVAGVVSAQPGVILGEAGENKVMIATTGRVKIKVDATRAPVRIGDLLVTSDREGYAMKSEPISVGGRQLHAPGTLLGKALEPLEKGVGEILVLLSLQ